MQTKNCIRCFKPAKIYSGHVLDDKGKQITAGWCSERCMNKQGFCGHYYKKMGLEGDI